MRCTYTAWVFLAGVLLLPVGWWTYTIGGGLLQSAYRNDEDLYALLALVDGLTVLLGFTLILTAIFQALRSGVLSGDFETSTSVRLYGPDICQYADTLE